MTEEQIRRYIDASRAMGHADGLLHAAELARTAAQVFEMAGAKTTAAAMVSLAKVLGEESKKRAGEVAAAVTQEASAKT